MVIGSVEHDSWKTGITIGKGNIYNVGSLVCYGVLLIRQRVIRNLTVH